MTARWEMGQQDRGIEPIPGWLDDDLGNIAVGKELGIPATDVAALPAHWVAAAMIGLESQAMNAERRGKR